jgi:leucyl aminopeptidase
VGRLYVGIADLDDYDEIRQGASAAIRQVKSMKVKCLKVGIYGDDKAVSAQALVEGFILGAYTFNKFKKEKTKNNISRIIVSTESYDNKRVEFTEIKKALEAGVITGESVNYVRDLVNQPPSDLTAIDLANEAKALAKEIGVEIKIYGKKFLEKEKMGAFLAVNRASAVEPQFIHLAYKGDNAKKKVVIVGKGLTYDTGGLSLKPTKGMIEMKMDMGGAGAALGIIRAVSLLGLPVELNVIIGATDNAIGNEAYRPGDIVIARNGKSIEVKNTDAEGRLVLADCLSYAQDLNPDNIIDIATLTGAVIVGLGNYTIGVMAHNENLTREIVRAGKLSGEMSAYLPFNKYLARSVKGDISDIMNLSSDDGMGGAISAGLFLSEFIEKKNKDKWLHLDVAGPAIVGKPWGYNPKGGSGAGVRIVTEFLKKLDK